MTSRLDTQNIKTTEDLDLLVDTITALLHTAVDEQCPILNKKKRVCNAWYTTELRKMKEALGKRQGTESAKQLSNRYKKLVKQAKREHISKTIEEKTNSKDISNILNTYNLSLIHI